MTLDRLAARLGTKFARMEMKSLVTKSDFQGQRLVLAKPHTYMNLSGQAVGSLVRFYKIPLNRLMVVYDEVDLPLGNLRLRPGGGSAGHKGMASIIERLATQDFPRLRIGVGRPPGRKEASDYVLQDFSAAEKRFMDDIFDSAAQAVLTFVIDGLDAVMNRFNPQTESDGSK
jgi:PTH1 family peptidyl-tRNA hydrolase